MTHTRAIPLFCCLMPIVFSAGCSHESPTPVPPKGGAAEWDNEVIDALGEYGVVDTNSPPNTTLPWGDVGSFSDQILDLATSIDEAAATHKERDTLSALAAMEQFLKEARATIHHARAYVHVTAVKGSTAEVLAHASKEFDITTPHPHYVVLVTDESQPQVSGTRRVFREDELILRIDGVTPEAAQHAQTAASRSDPIMIEFDVAGSMRYGDHYVTQCGDITEDAESLRVVVTNVRIVD